MIRTAFGALALVGALLASGHAAAVNVIDNGSFESGLSGWTEIDDFTCQIGILQEGESALAYFGGFTGYVAPPATDGSFVLVTDPEDAGSCIFYQDVAIPVGTSAELSADIGYLFDDTVPDDDFGDVSACLVSVAVTTTGGAPIASLYSNAGGTDAEALAPRGPLDISAQAGNTVRIIAEARSCNGPVGLVIDNVVLDVTASIDDTSGDLDDPADVNPVGAAGGSVTLSVAPKAVPALPLPALLLTAVALAALARRRLSR